jgi:hypothetical protein
MGLDHEVDVLVYLTDAEGTFPKEEPPYQVIWAVLKGHNTSKIPFGHIVEVEL